MSDHCYQIDLVITIIVGFISVIAIGLVSVGVTGVVTVIAVSVVTVVGMSLVTCIAVTDLIIWYKIVDVFVSLFSPQFLLTALICELVTGAVKCSCDFIFSF